MYRFAPERVLDVVNESRTFISSNVLNGAQRLNDLNKLLVTAVSEVPNVTGHKTAAGAGYDSLLECDFHAQKSTAKDLAPMLRSYVVESITCAGPTRHAMTTGDFLER
jgi:hypothetical protein